MAEFSGFWTTTGTPAGHQVAGYTQVHLSTAMQVLAACHGNQGIGPSYLNKLAGTVTGANTVQINTGCALVDGKWYNNDAALNVTIPSSVGGGNTRIDRIVARCNWAGFVVSIQRIPGTDAGSPTVPALSNTPGTTVDLPLYQALVNTAGTVTLTDERSFARIQQLDIIDTILTANAAGLLKMADGFLSADAGGRAKMAASFLLLSHMANGLFTADATGRGKFQNGFVNNNLLDANAVTTANIVNRTRNLFLPPTFGWNITDSVEIPMKYRAAEAQYFGETLAGKDSLMFAKFSCPNDYDSSMTVKPVFLTASSGGNCYNRSLASYAAVGETMNINQDGTAFAATAVSGYTALKVGPTMTLDTIDAADIVQLTWERDATNVLDTMGTGIQFLGFQVSYTADS